MSMNLQRFSHNAKALGSNCGVYLNHDFPFGGKQDFVLVPVRVKRT